MACGTASAAWRSCRSASSTRSAARCATSCSGASPRTSTSSCAGHGVEELLALCRALRQGRRVARRGASRGRALLADLGAARGHRGRPAAPRDADRAGRARTSRATRTPTSASSPTPSCRCATTSSAATSRSTRWRGTCARGEWIDPFGGREDLRAGRPARSARDGVPRRSAAHPARRRALQPRRAAARRGHARADGRGRAAHRRALGRARSARSSSARSRAPAPSHALRLARDVGALAVALPEWAPCIGFDQQSATQAYTLDEHILHVLDAAVHDDAAREPRLAAFWHDVGKPACPGSAPARRGGRAHHPRPRCAA